MSPSSVFIAFFFVFAACLAAEADFDKGKANVHAKFNYKETKADSDKKLLVIQVLDFLGIPLVNAWSELSSDFLVIIFPFW